MKAIQMINLRADSTRSIQPLVQYMLGIYFVHKRSCIICIYEEYT